MSSGQGPIGDALANGMHVTRGVRGRRARSSRASRAQDSTRSAEARRKLTWVMSLGAERRRPLCSVDASRCVRVMQNPVSRDRKVRSIVTPGTAPTRLRRVMTRLSKTSPRTGYRGPRPPSAVHAGQGTSSTPTGALTFTSSARGEIESLAIARNLFGATRRESASIARCTRPSAA